MLRLFEYSAKTFENGQLSILHEASGVKVTHEINGERTLEFDYPYPSEKTKLIKENRIAVCEGQAYRIMQLSRDDSGAGMMHVKCMHVFNADLRGVHVQSFGGTDETIGANPSEVMGIALNGTPFTMLTEKEVSALGMKRIGDDGFLIDFETVDKTTPYDIISQIIKNCGKGELYCDNYKAAIVERIGTDNGLRLELSHNMQNVTVEKDISSMVTRLYPYGRDDAHIGSVNGNKQYVDSENISLYGIKEGYRDYSDYIEPADIKAHALWEFDAENEDRIDVPDINITGDVIDLSKLGLDMYGMKTGDTVHIIDNGTEITERIIKIERHPYDESETTLSIGRVKKDLFFYLNQMGAMSKRYTKNTTSNGKVSARAISGNVKTASNCSSAASDLNAVISDALLKINEGSRVKCRIGNVNGKFGFEVYNRSNEKALYLDNSGLHIKAESIMIGNNEITNDANGNLCVNGSKIVLNN